MTTNEAKLTLPSDREILITRDFRAPKRLLFEAWSRPEYVAQWYGCGAMEMTSCQIDFRVGGTWRWALRDTGGRPDHVFSGEYRAIDRPDRLVFVERYEPIPGSDHLCTVTLDEQGGVTRMRMLLSYDSVEQRDGHLKSGMENGLWDALTRMESVAQDLERLAS